MVAVELPPLDDVLKDLKSLILSAPKNLTAKELFNDYYEMTHIKLNPRDYNFKSEDDFLSAFPQFFYAISVLRGQIQYGGISTNASTNTVAKLINNQKNSGKKLNVCLNDTNNQKTSTIIFNCENTPKKTIDTNKPSYSDFFKTPQPKANTLTNYEPSVTISKGSEIFSDKLIRSKSVKTKKKSKRHLIASRIDHKSSPNKIASLHEKMSHLNVGSLKHTRISSNIHNKVSKPIILDSIDSSKATDLRNIIEQNRTFNKLLNSSNNKTTNNTIQDSMKAETNNIFKNHVSTNKINSQQVQPSHSIPKNNNIENNSEKIQKNPINNTDNNNELDDFVMNLRINVKKCLNLYQDSFCTLIQLQNNYYKLFGEPFHPYDMPKSDIIEIFDTYLSNVCMVLLNTKGDIYIKGIYNEK